MALNELYHKIRSPRNLLPNRISMNANTENKQRASYYFHRKPEGWNCAQSLFKAFQEESSLTDAEIEIQFRSKGGGRAEGGICGALYAAQNLAHNDEEKEYITREFEQRAGATTCRRLKGECHVPCIELVDLAQDLIQESRTR